MKNVWKQKRDDLVDDVKGILFYFKEIESNMSENDFQRDFVESLQVGFDRYGTLTQAQFDALVKVYERVTR